MPSVADLDSSQVLEAYIDRTHPDWRDHVQESGEQVQQADESIMTRDLAVEILGLNEPWTRDEVIRAHRQLMQKLHPDRGGSDYLAKKINTAKDFLLEQL